MKGIENRYKIGEKVLLKKTGKIGTINSFWCDSPVLEYDNQAIVHDERDIIPFSTEHYRDMNEDFLDESCELFLKTVGIPFDEELTDCVTCELNKHCPVRKILLSYDALGE